MTGPGTSLSTRIAALRGGGPLLTVAAVAAALGAVVAVCVPPSARRPLAQRTPAREDEVERVLRDAGATGPVRAVWVWNPGWVDRDPGAEPLLRALEWVAATGPDDAPTGTVTARQGAAPRSVAARNVAAGSTVTVTGTTDDAVLAAALSDVGPEETLVSDGSDWLVVAGDRVRPLHGDARPDLPGTVTVAEYRDALAARRPVSGRVGDTVGG
jgi:hypothetical protein